MSEIKIAVHLHLYYFDMWDRIRSLLTNISEYDYDLFVTVVENNEQIISNIKEFHPKTTVYKVENRGYDVGPFVFFLNQINLNDYDYILKIHTKNASNGVDTLINRRYISRKLWSFTLLHSVLGSRKLVKKNLELLKNNRIGMIGSRYLITDKLKNHPAVEIGVKNIMSELGFHNFSNICFVAGTMFWVKSKLLAPIKEKFSINDFPISDSKVKDGTLAHILERVMGCLVIAQGFGIKGCDKVKELNINHLWTTTKRFCFYKKITNSNKLLIKILKLPVCNKKIS